MHRLYASLGFDALVGEMGSAPLLRDAVTPLHPTHPRHTTRVRSQFSSSLHWYACYAFISFNHWQGSAESLTVHAARRRVARCDAQRGASRPGAGGASEVVATPLHNCRASGPPSLAICGSVGHERVEAPMPARGVPPTGDAGRPLGQILDPVPPLLATPSVRACWRIAEATDDMPGPSNAACPVPRRTHRHNAEAHPQCIFVNGKMGGPLLAFMT